ncbi:hypothetical protein [Bradyrhizobium liaoningense]
MDLEPRLWLLRRKEGEGSTPGSVMPASSLALTFVLRGSLSASCRWVHPASRQRQRPACRPLIKINEPEASAPMLGEADRSDKPSA